VQICENTAEAGLANKRNNEAWPMSPTYLKTPFHRLSPSNAGDVKTSQGWVGQLAATTRQMAKATAPLETLMPGL